ncbi:MAG: hypothetical protein ACE5G2_11315 [Candidatus Krumholzibacteriia bacterium]
MRPVITSSVIQRLRAFAILVALAAFCVLLVRTYSRTIVRLDGMGYYAPLASIVFDGDLDLHNEFVHASPFMRNTYFMRPDGRAVDPYAIGAAVLWAPVFLVARALDPAEQANRQAPSRAGSPGFRPHYIRALAVATGLEALLGCILLYLALAGATGRLGAASGVAGAALGTPLIYYALADPSYAHAASFLVCSALLAAVLADRRRRLPLALLGALWGLACLVRWQDAVLGLLLAPRLLEEARAARRMSPVAALARITLFLVPAAIVFLPQILFWNEVYGRPLVMTVHRDFMHWGSPQILLFLFSTWHGAFIWSPLLVAGFAGIVLAPHRGLRWALLGAVALEIYICSAAGDWWGSGGFAARRLTAIAPLAGYGLSLLVARFATRAGRLRWRTAIAVGLVVVGSAWNMRLAQYNIAGLMPFNPHMRIDYTRHYPRGDPGRERYEFWDHARLAREIVDAERMMWKRSR